MARVSRCNENYKVLPSEVIWKAGLYRRLSKDDVDESSFSESESIESQKYIQEDFLSSMTDIIVVDSYDDDGYTGGNEDRPEFQRMLEDIDKKRINCVIVKDLSRFVRDDYAQSKYTQIVFAEKQVRFISIAENIDSIKDPYSVHEVKAKVKAIMNENVLFDTSKKVRSILDMKRDEGEFIGAFAPYGYKKDSENHNKLVVDKPAAETVRLIFQWFLEGSGIRRIAMKLSELGIPNPTKYKQINNLKFHSPNSDKNDGYWSGSTVRRILINQMYIGDMVQGKSRKINYKINKHIQTPKDEWFIKENTHEAIIDKTTFATVQKLLKQDTRTAPKDKELSLFAGLLKCSDCGKALLKKHRSVKNPTYHYYVCRSYHKFNNACTRHSIRSDKLEKTVFTILSKFIELADDMSSIINRINSNPKKQKTSDYLNNAIMLKEKEREKVECVLLDLYPDYKNELLTLEEYKKQQARYRRELDGINERIAQLTDQLDKEKNGVDNNNDFLANFRKYKNIKYLSRTILVTLIEQIKIEDGGGIEIDFKFQDAFKNAIAYIEKNDSDKMQYLLSFNNDIKENRIVAEA